MFGQASSFRRTFVVLRRPRQKCRVNAAESLNLAMPQSFDSNRRIDVQEDDEIKGILQFVTPFNE